MKYVLIALLLVGCASQPADELEVEIQMAEARENLANCLLAYQGSRTKFVHYQHEPGREKRIDVTSDLHFNECRRVLGELWVE